MDSEQRRFLDAARELIEEIERPSAYAILGLTRETPSYEIQKAVGRAISKGRQHGYSTALIADAHKQLQDAEKRLAFDTQVLSLDEWLRELDAIRNRYALFDFLEEARRR